MVRVRVKRREQGCVVERLIAAARSTELVLAVEKVAHVRELASCGNFAALNILPCRTPSSSRARESLTPVLLARKTGKTRGGELGSKKGHVLQNAPRRDELRRAPKFIVPRSLMNACTKYTKFAP